ncbi:hypothetical protein AKJ09_01563 [Labilithrix luteola]|uniref:Lipoprotein n=1 Tax=Labilithrix luteola TaxID=1391654 RepID=A0A0K1PP54_9BACT|nr:hypothetical protein [Labilithrix luteola]AKU94899.1 hypothetical protein AKJ09_01563 [Labilithrix luteola]
MRPMNYKRVVFPAVCLLTIAAAVACGDDETNSTPVDDGVDSSTPHQQPDASKTDSNTPDAKDATSGNDAGADADADAEACESPVTFKPDANAKTKATAALAALSPDATLQWSDARGTIASISDLVVSPACTGNDDVYDKFFDYLEAHRDLFQIERSDWRAPPPLPCSAISGFQFVSIHREKLGAYEEVNDTFSVVADVKDGNVIFRNFSGFYIPSSTIVGPQLGDCADKTEAQMTPLLRAEPFAYATLNQCNIDGSFKYTPVATDKLTFAPSATMTWEEGTELTLRRQRTATLVVSSANYTNDLLRSNANCPDDDGNPNIGWIRTYDTVTGEIISDSLTPDPYCLVCFGGGL